ncbi:MAG: rhomboid family intramembrane serine protease [Clostridiales bacterium]|nr:rhomboid family intramembrane serine protease [Clostridiales bacterium]
MTPINITFALINVAVYVVLEIMGDTGSANFMLAHGAMYPPAVVGAGQWYRLLTAAFLHFGLYHLVNNMILLICLGSYLEREYGRVRFIIFYLIGAVGANLVSMVHMLYTGEYYVSGGASGVVFAMIGALLFAIVRYRGRFENLTIKRFLVMVVLCLYFGFTSVGTDNAAHVGGLIIGFVMGFIYFLLEKLWRALRGDRRPGNRDQRNHF